MNNPRIIVRRSLHEEIVERLRDLIVGGELKPGEKIQEVALCDRFGVSRTPLREALKALAAEGLITLQQNRGALVSRITPEAIIELFPIMGALEALAGELACERITDEQVAALQLLHDRMAKHFEKGEWTPYIKINRDIHAGIFAAGGNASLSAMYQQLLVRTHAVRFVLKKSETRWREALQEHEQMMKALKARDGRALSEIMKLHLKHKAEAIFESIGSP